MSRPSKRRSALKGEAAERMAELRRLRTAGELLDLPMDEFHRLYDGRPIGRDSDLIEKFGSQCKWCGATGHWAKDCTDLLCHTCHQPGHKASRCPNKDAL